MTVSSARIWENKKVLITSGPTREPLDPIRFITNASSGRMGFSLARLLRGKGASVTVVSGPVSATPPKGVRVLPVTTAKEMHREVLALCGKADVVIAAAAVGDWRFQKISPLKLKKRAGELRVTLVQNPDIIADVSRSLRAKASGGKRAVLVGFALETHDKIAHAKEKLLRKGLDLIVANEPDSMGSDRARVALLDRSGAIQELPPMGKDGVARRILRRIEDFL